jgi:oligopeptide/dipeptide ABC transporter ATP-binding protein
VEVNDLRVTFGVGNESRNAVDGVTFALGRGERVAIVGESGSGKSMTALSLMGLLPGAARITSGDIRINQQSVVGQPLEAWRQLRGREIGMIFQDPMTALNPVHPIGKQIIEAIRLHQSVDYTTAQKEAVELLERVQVPSASDRLADYPHQFSGGMRQRVMIAMAVANRPTILVADEPTTALDVTTQAQVLALLDEICIAQGMSILFISHNLNLVSGFCDRILVMYAGRIVEEGQADDTLVNPRHPYTAGLVASMPPLEEDVEVLTAIPGEAAFKTHDVKGCLFEPRCTWREPKCRSVTPPLRNVSAEHSSACHFAERLLGRLGSAHR